jgi:hypothetical protein
MCVWLNVAQELRCLVRVRVGELGVGWLGLGVRCVGH